MKLWSLRYNIRYCTQYFVPQSDLLQKVLAIVGDLQWLDKASITPILKEAKTVPVELWTGQANLLLRRSWSQSFWKTVTSTWRTRRWLGTPAQFYNRQIMPDQPYFFLWWDKWICRQGVTVLLSNITSKAFNQVSHYILVAASERYVLVGELKGGWKTYWTTWFKKWQSKVSTGGAM